MEKTWVNMMVNCWIYFVANFQSKPCMAKSQTWVNPKNLDGWRLKVSSLFVPFLGIEMYWILTHGHIYFVLFLFCESEILLCSMKTPFIAGETQFSLIKSIVSDSKQMQFMDQNPSSISDQYPHWIPNVGWFYSPLAAPRSCHRRRNLSAGCRAAERCPSCFRRRRGWPSSFFQVGMAWFMGLSWHFCMGWLPSGKLT